MFAPAHLWLPRWSLSACVRACMSRTTQGHVLSDEQRLNYFPASPLCGITWFVQGEVCALPFDPDPRSALQRRSAAQPWPALAFHGPFTGPSLSYVARAGHGFMLLLMPDALRLLTGIDPSRYMNRFVPAADVLPADWQGLLDGVMGAADDAARLRLIEDFLDPRWQAARPDDSPASRLMQDWAQGLALRAGTSGLGRSLRQSERRIKEWTGQSLRQLRVQGRGERSFIASAEVIRAGGAVDWAEVAAAGGYADQSHLCRESRRLTGFTPNELRRRVLEDESAWVYRIWGG